MRVTTEHHGAFKAAAARTQEKFRGKETFGFALGVFHSCVGGGGPSGPAGPLSLLPAKATTSPKISNGETAARELTPEITRRH